MSPLLFIVPALGMATSQAPVSDLLEQGVTQRLEMPVGSPFETELQVTLEPTSDGWLTVEARSLHLDTVVEVQRLLLPNWERRLVGWDDDSGRGTNSRVSFPVVKGDRYFVTVRPGVCNPWLEFDDDYGLVLEDWGGPVEIELRPGKLAPEPARADETYWQDVLRIARETYDARLEGRALVRQAMKVDTGQEVALERAVADLNTAVTLFRRELGQGTAAIATAQMTRTMLLLAGGQKNRARESAAEVANQIDLGVDDDLQTANLLFGLGARHVPMFPSRLSTDQAAAYLQRSLEIRERLLGRDNPRIGWNLVELATTSKPADTGMLIRTMVVQGRHGVPDPALKVQAFMELAGLLEFALRPHKAVDQAVSKIAQSSARHSPAGGGRHPPAVRELTLLGYWQFWTGRFAAAEQTLDRAGRMIEESPTDAADVAAYLTLSGLILHATGDYDEARRRLERAATIRDGQQDGAQTEVFYALGNVLRDAALAEEARAAYLRALLASELSYRRRHGPQVAVSDRYWSMGIHIQLARLALDRDDLEEARIEVGRFLEQVGTVARILETSSPAQFRIMSDSNVIVKLMEPLLATTVFRKTREIQEGVEYGQALLSGQRQPGGEAELETLRTSLQAFGLFIKPSSSFAMALPALGDLLRELGWPAEALVVYEVALEMLVKELGTAHLVVAQVLDGMSAASWDLGRRKPALDQASRAATAQSYLVRAAVAELPEQRVLTMLRNLRKPETVLFSGLLEAGDVFEEEWLDACWDWVLFRRAAVLEELAERNRRLYQTESAESERAWLAWREARRELAMLWVQGAAAGQAASHEKAIEQAEQRRDRTEKELARASAVFRRERAYRTAKLKQVRRALPRGTALVEYVRVPIRRPGELDAREHYVALILSGMKGHAPSWVDLGVTETTDELVVAWRQQLEDSYPLAADSIPIDDALETGHRLRQVVWDPIAQRVGETSAVFVVPDGALHRLNLSTLPSSNGQYLARAGPPFHLLGTARDLVRFDKTSPTSTVGLIAVGDPDFGADSLALAEAIPPRSDDEIAAVYRGRSSQCRSLAARQWDRLPRSGREAREVAALLDENPSVVLTGVAASEERFKLEAPGKRYIHVATHGFFYEPSCGRASDQDRPAERTADESPLLRSGLVLAGANQLMPSEGDREDGILTAEELSALDLRGLEIMALSGCDTGTGAIADGEGVLGLRRALEVAGARSILMSLWPVNDEQARAWMHAFYEKRTSGESILASTQMATLTVLDSLERDGVPTHPYLWGGFVAAGDWR